VEAAMVEALPWQQGEEGGQLHGVDEA